MLIRLRSLQEQITVEKLAGLGQLAAIAHEFNNLIGGMLGYANLPCSPRTTGK